jgi:tetratricopeptide (TPR) repeat protein
MQDVLDKDKEGKTADIFRTALLKRIQKHPEKLYFSEMLYWLAVQEKNFRLALSQAKAIDKRTGSDGNIVLELAKLCISNEEYDVAIDSYKYVLKKGKDNIYYLDARIGLLNARYQKITGSFDYTKKDLDELEKDYISVLDEYGRNATTIKVMEYLGHLQAFYLDQTDDAIDILNYAIQIPNASAMNIAQCKIELADILLFVGNVWDAKLLYSQVEKQFKNDPVGHLAKFKNAKLSFYIGQFDWAKAQLDVLKAATSKFIANDALQLSVLISDNIDTDSSTVALSMYAHADLLLYRNHDKEALEVLDSIFDLAANHPIFDEVLYKKAEIMIKEGKFNKAVDYLDEIVDKYSYDITADDAIFLLGELYEKHLNNKDKAMDYYQQLLTGYPASVYTARARKHFRYLRGDFDSEGDTGDEEIMLENKL